MESVRPSRPTYTACSGSSALTMWPRHRSRPKRRSARRREVSRWISVSRSIASRPVPPGALRSASRRSDSSAIDCSRHSATAAKCRSSRAISFGSALGERRSGRSNALMLDLVAGRGGAPGPVGGSCEGLVGVCGVGPVGWSGRSSASAPIRGLAAEPCRAAASRRPSRRRCGSCRRRRSARARVSGARATASAADRDSKVGVGPSCAAPMPSSATRAAQYGWSTICGTTTWGAPARAAVVVVPAPP